MARDALDGLAFSDSPVGEEDASSAAALSAVVAVEWSDGAP